MRLKCAVCIPYPRERAPTTECPPTPLFWLNFLLRSKVYALYIVRNLLHYNNDAAASYLVWNQRRLEPETQARDLSRPRAICAMLGMQSEVCNHTLYHR